MPTPILVIDNNPAVDGLRYNLRTEEEWQSGLMYRTRNAAYRKVPRVRIPPLPPVQRPQTCSAGLEAASGPATRGAFCFGLLTATCRSGLGKASQTPFVSKPHDFSDLVPSLEFAGCGKTGFEPIRTKFRCSNRFESGGFTNPTTTAL